MQGGVTAALLKYQPIMGRTKKTETVQADEGVAVENQSSDATTYTPNLDEQFTEEIKANKSVVMEINSCDNISPRDAELMRLYPQYEKFWVTPRGFVHPEGAPKYLIKDAKLLTNKFFHK